MKRFIIKILQFLAKRVVKKYHPTIIAITGSVGKTSTKEAIFAVLERKLNVIKNKGNYNTEIGLPITIIGSDTPGKNPFKWLVIYFKAIGLLLIKRKYPKVLVLEMGADKPGDIAELIDIAPPTIGIITAISATHTEKFKTISAVAREKGKLFRAIERDGWIIVNNDRQEVCDIANKCDTKKAFIGMCDFGDNNKDSRLNICASEISVSMSESNETGIAGLSFKLHTDGKVIPILINGIIGHHQVYIAMFAAAVARILGLHMVDVAEGLNLVNPQPGRMRVLSGIKHTVLIDDTYNSSPNAAERAIESLCSLSLGDGIKYAILGDMLELGPLSEDEHSKLGRFASKAGIDILITVGERARDIARGAKKAGMSSDYIFEFSNAKEAGLFIQNRIEKGDIILIKGSQGMRMERVVKEIMAEPERADELLVRQSKEWVNK